MQENESNESDKPTQDEQIREYGQVVLKANAGKHRIFLLSIIGEVEGHEQSPGNVKTTKYEHVLPQLAMAEDSCDIASISKPTVALVLGGSHSIGVPLAVSADYSFIVPSGTMIIHPVRMNGMVIGVIQTYEYFERIQERILNFIVTNSRIAKSHLKKLMLDTSKLAKDVGTVLDGQETVDCGLIDAIGGISDALAKLNEMIDEFQIRSC